MRRPTDLQKLSVILPCFDEEGNLRLLERTLIPVLEKLTMPWEIVAVDDGSTDATSRVLKDLQPRMSHLKIITHPENRGLGAALRSGFDLASGDAVLTIDTDNTFSPDQIPNLLDAWDESVDAVFGSPALGRMDGVSGFRRLLSNGVNAVYRGLLGHRITAASSLFRLYRRSKLAALDLEAESFDINAEIAVKLLSAGATIKEVPAVLTVRTVGESKIRVGREIKNHLKLFFKILLWKFQ